MTINAVNMSKAVVLSVSKGSTGSVPVTGAINTSGYILANGTAKAGFLQPTSTASCGYITAARSSNAAPDVSAIYPVTITQSGSITATGQTDLTTKQYSAKLISATQLQTDGAVEWQVIEYA